MIQQARGEMVKEILGSLFDDSLLTATYDKLMDGQVQEGMEDLIKGLRERRLDSSDQEWADSITYFMQHPLKDLLHQDPFTFRAFAKPRGYAGDAALIDLIYSSEEHWPLPEGTTELGRQLFEYTSRAPAPEGVRARRESIARLLDEIGEETDRPHVLSIAAGHLRETLLSKAVRRKKLGRFVALDWDTESLEEVQRCYGKYGVETVPAPIRQLLLGKLDLGDFDLIYSTGLYDYLQPNVAQRLTLKMFRMLRPGGKLRVANFLPNINDIGYMESFMDWKLIYRTHAEMGNLAEQVPQDEIDSMRIFKEENNNIIFLDIVKM